MIYCGNQMLFWLLLVFFPLHRLLERTLNIKQTYCLSHAMNIMRNQNTSVTYKIIRVFLIHAITMLLLATWHRIYYVIPCRDQDFGYCLSGSNLFKVCAFFITFWRVHTYACMMFCCVLNLRCTTIYFEWSRIWWLCIQHDSNICNL